MAQARNEAIRQIRFVSAHYEMLQGVVVAPALLVLAFVMIAGTPAAEGLDRPVWYAAAMLLGALGTALAWRINRRFVEEYGEVRPSRRQGQGMFLLTVLALAPVAGVHQADLDVPVSPEGIVVSAVLLAAAVKLRPLALPLVTAGSAGLVASLLPLASLLDVNRHPLSVVEYLLATLCLAGAVVAVWTQLLLRQMLSRTE